MKNEKISIIIPVYNVEKYIDKCVQSAINQTYKNIEIVLIDDGSPDNCGKLCDEYAKKDDRIKVIHKKNGGLSDARNVGIKNATGKYVIFLDSDDYLEVYSVEYLYRLIEENDADISVGQIRPVYENQKTKIVNKTIEDQNVKVYDKEQALEAMLYNTKFTNSALGKLYRKDFFETIQYPIGKLYEDLATTYKLIDKSQKVVLGSNVVYNYLVNRDNSIMNNRYNSKRMQALEYVEEILCFVQKNYPKIEKSAIARLYMECIFILLKLPNNKKYKNDNIRVKKYLRKYRIQVIADKKMPLKQKMLCIAAIFGRGSLRIAWNAKEEYKRRCKK